MDKHRNTETLKNQMSAKKKPTEEKKTASEIVTVEVINQPLHEAGDRREKGDRFQVTAERAESLRHFVRIVEETTP